MVKNENYLMVLLLLLLLRSFERRKKTKHSGVSIHFDFFFYLFAIGTFTCSKWLERHETHDVHCTRRQTDKTVCQAQPKTP